MSLRLLFLIAFLIHPIHSTSKYFFSLHYDDQRQLLSSLFIYSNSIEFDMGVSLVSFQSQSNKCELIIKLDQLSTLSSHKQHHVLFYQLSVDVRYRTYCFLIYIYI
jgi:competence transcription factor ComK